MSKPIAALRACWKCEYYRPLEDRLGYCKLFGNTTLARMHKDLCTPEGKWFKEARVVEPKKKDCDLLK
jgi:hypothetical protein